jgi:hypothetical protein
MKKSELRQFIREEIYKLEERTIQPVNWNSLTIESGKVKLWHYSDKDITGNKISINKPRGLQSKVEFQAWARPRSFFYATEDGVYLDKNVPILYKYICYLDKNKIYDINENPHNYEGSFDEIYKKAYKDGYTAWIYNLGGKKNIPIVISFDDVFIADAYKKTLGGIYVPKDRKLEDYKIGKLKINGELWYVLQKSDKIMSLNNCYLRKPEDMNSSSMFKKQIPEHLLKNIEIDKKYQKYYKK